MGLISLCCAKETINKIKRQPSEWVSEVKWSRWVVSDSLQPRGLYPTKLLCPQDSPGQNTGVGYHFLLQGIFLTQGLNLGLPHCRQRLLPSEPPGKSRTYVELSLVQDCDFAKELGKEKGNQRCIRENNDNNWSCKLGTKGSEDTQGLEFQWIVDRITLLEVPEGLKGCWG